MKHKIRYLNIILLSLMFLVGFSPQMLDTGPVSSSIVVFAEESSTANDMIFDTDSGLTNHNIDSLNKNALSGLAEFTKVMDTLSGGFQKIALAISVACIALAGFKIARGNSFDLGGILKSRKDISNAFISAIFLLAIPTLVSGALDMKLTVTENDSSLTYEVDGSIPPPKSSYAEYIINNKSKFTPNVAFGDGIWDAAGGIWNTGDGVLQGIVKLCLNIVSALFAFVIYTPILGFTSFVCSIGFYPMSFDYAMYGKTVAPILESTIKASDALGVQLGTGMITSVAAALSQLTGIINGLYIIFRKAASICLEFACYYYGIMFMLNKDTSDISQFLKRFIEGVCGIILFPYFVEFLLDIDSFVSLSILRIAGESIPGYTLLTILPSGGNATNFQVLIIGIILAFLILNLGKAFFVRRIELMFYYMGSPIYFLKHIASNQSPVPAMIKRVCSSAFLSTAYAPLIVVTTTMLRAGATATSGSSGTTQTILLILVIGVLWKGKSIMTEIIGNFVGSSSATTRASKAVEEGIDMKKTLAKTAAIGATATAIGYGTVKAGQTIAKDGLKDTVGTVGKRARTSVIDSHNKRMSKHSRFFNKEYAEKDYRRAVNDRSAVDIRNTLEASDKFEEEHSKAADVKAYNAAGGDVGAARILKKDYKDGVDMVKSLPSHQKKSAIMHDSLKEQISNMEANGVVVPKGIKDATMERERVMRANAALGMELQGAIQNHDFDRIGDITKELSINQSFLDDNLKTTNKVLEFVGLEDSIERSHRTLSSVQANASAFGVEVFAKSDIDFDKSKLELDKIKVALGSNGNPDIVQGIANLEAVLSSKASSQDKMSAVASFVGETTSKNLNGVGDNKITFEALDNLASTITAGDINKESLNVKISTIADASSDSSYAAACTAALNNSEITGQLADLVARKSNEGAYKEATTVMVDSILGSGVTGEIKHDFAEIARNIDIHPDNVLKAFSNVDASANAKEIKDALSRAGNSMAKAHLNVTTAIRAIPSEKLSGVNITSDTDFVRSIMSEIESISADTANNLKSILTESAAGTDGTKPDYDKFVSELAKTLTANATNLDLSMQEIGMPGRGAIVNSLKGALDEQIASYMKDNGIRVKTSSSNSNSGATGDFPLDDKNS